MGHPPALILPLAALIVATLSGCGFSARACPAMGFVNDGPIELDLAGFTGKDLSFVACFSDTCTPEPVIADSSGRWLVPQKEPYLQPADTSLGSVVRIKVAVTESNLKIIERVYDIQTRTRADSTECLRSYDFVPVKIAT